MFGRARLDEGLRDEDWLPVVGAQGWVVFGRDLRIMDRPLELEAYLAAGIHMIPLPGEATRARLVELLAANLAEICAVVAARQPNVFWVTSHGLVDYQERSRSRHRVRNRRPTR